MSIQNVLPEILKAPWGKIDFPATLTVGDSTVSCTATSDMGGMTIHLKQGDVILPKQDWVFGFANDQSVVLTVVGWDYATWVKKLKKDKNPTSSESPASTGKAYHWRLGFVAKKLGADAVMQLKQNVLRSDVENYISGIEPSESVYLTRCPTCQSMMDVSPYSDSDNLYCNGCSRFLNPQLNGEDTRVGICPGCAYYTKLTGKGAASGSGLCHGCNAKATTSGFLRSVGIAVLLIGGNAFTIFFLNRFFPALLIIGAVSLIWSLIKFVGVIASSMTRTAVGISPLEKANALLIKGRAEDALKQIESIPNATGNPGVLLNLSRGLIRSKNYAKANQFAELLVNDYPNFQLGYAARLEAMHGSGATPSELDEVNREFNEVVCRNMVRSNKNIELLSSAT